MKERYTSYLRCVRCGRMVKGSDLLKNGTRVSNSVRFFDIMSDRPVPDMNSKYFLCPKCMKEFFRFMGLSEDKIGEFVYEDMSRFNSVDNKVNTELKDLQEENQKLRDDVSRLSMEKWSKE